MKHFRTGTSFRSLETVPPLTTFIALPPFSLHFCNNHVRAGSQYILKHDLANGNRCRNFYLSDLRHHRKNILLGIGALRRTLARGSSLHPQPEQRRQYFSQDLSPRGQRIPFLSLQLFPVTFFHLSLRENLYLQRTAHRAHNTGKLSQHITTSPPKELSPV